MNICLTFTKKIGSIFFAFKTLCSNYFYAERFCDEIDFTTYSNLNAVNVKIGQDVTTGQQIGKVAANLEGVGAVDFFMSNETSNFDPEKWLRRK